MIENKVWGQVQHIFDGPVSVSLLRVNAGFCCSKHYHAKRWNHFFVVSGMLGITIYDEKGRSPVMAQTLKAGESFTVPPGAVHRFDVLQSGQVVETYWTSGGPVEHSDIVRFDTGGKF